MLELFNSLFCASKDPVLVVLEGEIIYKNTAAVDLGEDISCLDEYLTRPAPFTAAAAFGDNDYHIVAAAASEYTVFTLYTSSDNYKNIFAKIGTSLMESIMPIQSILNLMPTEKEGGLAEKYQTILFHQFHSIRRVAGRIAYLGDTDSNYTTDRFDLVTLINDLVDTTNHLTGKKPAQIEFDTKLLYLPLEGSPTLTEKLLLIILSNSLKYTPADGSIKISLTRRSGKAIITIKDSGCGIAEKALPYIFSLNKPEPELDSTSQSVGLGLVMAKDIVSDMKGTIIITNNKDCGASVTISLPITTDESTMHLNNVSESYKNITVFQTELSDVLESKCYSESYRD